MKVPLVPQNRAKPLRLSTLTLLTGRTKHMHTQTYSLTDTHTHTLKHTTIPPPHASKHHYTTSTHHYTPLHHLHTRPSPFVSPRMVHCGSVAPDPVDSGGFERFFPRWTKVICWRPRSHPGGPPFVQLGQVVQMRSLFDDIVHLEKREDISTHRKTQTCLQEPRNVGHSN